VDVRSRVGEGTTVSLFIPAKRVAGSADPRALPAPPLTSAARDRS